jgi:STAS domain
MPHAAVVVGDAVVVCDAGALIKPDLGTIDALARLALAARRNGRGMLLRRASPALCELLALSALANVVRGLVVEVGG